MVDNSTRVYNGSWIYKSFGWSGRSNAFPLWGEDKEFPHECVSRIERNFASRNRRQNSQRSLFTFTERRVNLHSYFSFPSRSALERKKRNEKISTFDDPTSVSMGQFYESRRMVLAIDIPWRFLLSGRSLLDVYYPSYIIDPAIIIWSEAPEDIVRRIRRP